MAVLSKDRNINRLATFVRSLISFGAVQQVHHYVIC